MGKFKRCIEQEHNPILHRNFPMMMRNSEFVQYNSIILLKPLKKLKEIKKS